MTGKRRTGLSRFCLGHGPVPFEFWGRSRRSGTSGSHRPDFLIPPHQRLSLGNPPGLATSSFSGGPNTMCNFIAPPTEVQSTIAQAGTNASAAYSRPITGAILDPESRRRQGAPSLRSRGMAFPEGSWCGSGKPGDPRSPDRHYTAGAFPADALEAAGTQKRSKALVKSDAISCASRPSISERSSIKTSFPSRRRAIEGDEGGYPVK